MIDRAYWLKSLQREVLLEVKKSAYFLALSPQKRRFLLLLLLSVLYGEDLLIRNGKKTTQILEKCLDGLKIRKFVCTTLGMWNFHICHAERFGYSKKAFRALLEDPLSATEIVIRHFVEDIGLEKPPELIFAEYNHNIMATSVAALQKALNACSSTRVLEDGLIGPGTLRAFDSCASYLPDFFSPRHLNEEMVLRTLAHFKSAHGICFEPCVPEVVIKKDLRFIGSILIMSLKDLRKLRRLRALFERNIDIPRYVEDPSLF